MILSQAAFVGLLFFAVPGRLATPLQYAVRMWFAVFFQSLFLWSLFLFIVASIVHCSPSVALNPTWNMRTRLYHDIIRAVVFIIGVCGLAVDLLKYLFTDSNTIFAKHPSVLAEPMVVLVRCYQLFFVSTTLYYCQWWYILYKSRMKRLEDRMFKLGARLEKHGDNSPAHECSICNQELETGQTVCHLQLCQHVFHKKCVEQYLRYIESLPKCPACFVDREKL